MGFAGRNPPMLIGSFATSARALTPLREAAQVGSIRVPYESALGLAATELKKSYDADGFNSAHRISYLDPKPIVDSMLDDMRAVSPRFTRVLWNEAFGAASAASDVSKVLTGLYWTSGRQVLPRMKAENAQASGLFVGSVREALSQIKTAAQQSYRALSAVEIDLSGPAPVFTVAALSIQK